MKKKSPKIVLSRETLCRLELRSPVGGTEETFPPCESVHMECDPPYSHPIYCFTVEATCW